MIATEPRAKPRRAVEVIRVSKVGKRTKEKFVSPEDQRNMTRGLAAQQGWLVVASFQELDVSGYRTKLEKRKGLYPALQMVERGEADIVVFAFSDRMARNIIVQTEFLGRVAEAGGEVWAADVGQIQTDTATAALSTGMLGLVSQFMAQQTAEKTAGPKKRAIELGIPTFPYIPIGYRRGEDRRLVVDEDEAKLVRGAYEQRAARASLATIRDWLRSNGLNMTSFSVQDMLKNRIYLGELRFGKLVNLHAHEAIVAPALFRSVQGMRVSRGPRTGQSTRLLARQGIVRCASCGRALIVGSQTHRGKVFFDYRCQVMGDCKARVSIGADLLERCVVEYMKAIQTQGRGSIDQRLSEAEAAVEATGKKLSRFMAISADSDDDDIEGVLEKKAELRAAHDAAREQLQALRSALGSSLTVTLADWDTASLERQRRLLRIVFERIEVGRGRGTERIKPFFK